MEGTINIYYYTRDYLITPYTRFLEQSKTCNQFQCFLSTEKFRTINEQVTYDELRIH